MEKLDRSHDENSSFASALIECSDRTISRETDWTRSHNGNSRAVYVECGSVGIDEF